MKTVHVSQSRRFAAIPALVGICAFLGPIAAPASGAQTASPAQAGVAAAVHGKVEQVSLAVQPPADRGPAVGHLVASGDHIFLNDHIRTGPKAGLQIMLLDETVFTIGPNAELVIDKFVYDPDRDAGEVAASIVKGAFRFVSGRVAKLNPTNMHLKVGPASLGIRGTAAAGNVSDTLPDGSPGTTVDVVLLGPGPDNNADERDGRITLSNGGSNVEISRPGFGTTIVGSGGTPGLPVRWSPEKLSRVTGQTAPGNGPTGATGGENGNGGGGNGTGESGGGGGGVTGNFTQLSGQTLGASLETVTTVEQNDGTTDPANDTVNTVAENTGAALATITSYEDLRTISSGYADILFSNVPLSYVSGATTMSGGSFDGGISIDFAARTITPFVSQAQYNFSTQTNQFSYSENVNYANSSGQALGGTDSSSDPGLFSFSNQSASDVAKIEGKLLNDPNSGTIPSAGMLTVTVQSGTDGTVISGSATSPATISSSGN